MGALSLLRRQGLNVVDLEDLLEDIRVYHELKKDIHLTIGMYVGLYMLHPLSIHCAVRI